MKNTRESIIALLAEDIQFIAERRAERAWRTTYELTASASDASIASRETYASAIREMKEVFQD
jgi:hypothetical protein